MRASLGKIAGVVAVGTVAAALIAGDAVAQVRRDPLSARVVNSMSAVDVQNLLRPMEYSPAYQSDRQDDKVLSGRRGDLDVDVILSDCNGRGRYAQCEVFTPTLVFDAASFSLSEINRFNVEESTVSVAGIDRGGDGLLTARITLRYGVTLATVRAAVDAFLEDADVLLGRADPRVRGVNFTPDKGAALDGPVEAATISDDGGSPNSAGFADEAIKAFLAEAAGDD